MIVKEQKLSNKIFTKDIETKSTRDGYGEGLVLAGDKDERIVVLSADTESSNRNSSFSDKYPERHIQVGVSEQVLVTVAAGMAAYGKIPFATTYAIFSPGRNWEQIRTTIAFNDVPVKIGGGHTGLAIGEDGATHQALEDVSLMRVIPNMIVVVPADAIEMKKSVVEAAKNKKPTYLRFTKLEIPIFTTEESPFKIGRAEVLWEDRDPKVTLIACGIMVYEALKAAKELSKNGIGSIVINSHTIKPLDEQTIIRAAKTTGCVVTAEDHQITGGLGSAVAEVLSQKYPIPIEFVGVKNIFGESGRPKELMKKFGLTYLDIANASKRVIRRTTI